MPMPSSQRRRFVLTAAAAALLAPARGAFAQDRRRQPLADMHSHYAMFRNDPAAGADMRRHMEETGTSLLGWALVDDTPFTVSTPQGIRQVRQPAEGELWEYFQRRAARYDAQLRAWNIPKALTPADVDAAVAGAPHIVMASESANFLEGRPERVASAHAMGLRHLQLVHFIASPLGDLQTDAPRHDKGMAPVALQVIQECQRLGVLVDLAHCAPAFVEAALAASDAAMVWSHSWVSRRGGTWRDWPNMARSLSPELARRIAAHGGVLGLWTVRVRSEPGYPVTGVEGYADEIMRMVEQFGPRAVAFGTDMGGAGSTPAMTHYGELRAMADRLAQRGMPQAVLHDVCIGNYARVLKQAMG